MPITRKRDIATVEYFKQEEINNIYYNLTLSEEKYASNDKIFLQELSNRMKNLSIEEKTEIKNEIERAIEANTTNSNNEKEIKKFMSEFNKLIVSEFKSKREVSNTDNTRLGVKLI